MKKFCIAATVALVITGCSDKTTTHETNHEENTTKQENKQENPTPSNTEYVKQYEGYWKSEDGSVFVEIKNTPDHPLYVIITSRY
jgi:PBP1b-binding outer membrane lipoprotein LpoB